MSNFKKMPKMTFLGQCFFLLTILIFIITAINGGMFSTNYALYGVFAGCTVGVITTLVSRSRSWSFILLDIVLAIGIFIFYVEILA